ncbi:MAG: hypothetical protein GC152_03630 [Alphaproteobacteria bacterium]|nr:hypothetical protein [Alphaproteobacteria bacterium]
MTTDNPQPEPHRTDARRQLLSRRDAHLLAGQLSELTSSNLPVVPGLRAFAEELQDSSLSGGQLRRHLLALADRLEQGDSVELALTQAGAPRDLLFALQTGLASGHPDRTLADYVTYAKSSTELWTRMLIGLAGPILLFCLTSALFIVVLMTVIPQFVDVFDGFGLELPLLTKWLFDTSSFLNERGWVLLLLAAACVLGVHVWSRFDPYLFPKCLRYVPLFGSVSRFTTMSKLCYALGFMTEHEVALPSAVRLAGEATEDPEMIRLTTAWGQRMEEGMSLEEASAPFHQLPMEIIRTCQWESQPEILSNSLKSLGGMYAARALNLTMLIASLAEPLIIVLSGIVFFFIVSALFLPLTKLLNDLS